MASAAIVCETSATTAALMLFLASMRGSQLKRPSTGAEATCPPSASGGPPHIEARMKLSANEPSLQQGSFYQPIAPDSLAAGET